MDAFKILYFALVIVALYTVATTQKACVRNFHYHCDVDKGKKCCEPSTCSLVDQRCYPPGHDPKEGGKMCKIKGTLCTKSFPCCDELKCVKNYCVPK